MQENAPYPVIPRGETILGSSHPFIQQPFQTAFEGRQTGWFGLTFPDSDDPPAHGSQLPPYSAISGHIGLKLRLPEGLAC